jgi:hypothetical protein
VIDKRALESSNLFDTTSAHCRLRNLPPESPFSIQLILVHLCIQNRVDPFFAHFLLLLRGDFMDRVVRARDGVSIMEFLWRNPPFQAGKRSGFFLFSVVFA